MPRRAELAQSLGLPPEDVDEAVTLLLDCGAIRQTARHRLIHAERLAKVKRAVDIQLAAFHRANPLRTGMPRGEIRHATAPKIGTHAYDEVLELLAEAGQVRLGDDWVAAAGFAIKPTPRQQALLDRVVDLYRSAGLMPPSLAEATAAIAAPAQAVQAMVQLGQDLGLLVQLGPDACFAAEAVAQARALMEAEIDAHGSITASTFRDIAGTSRKLAVQLLEYMDELGVTVREDDARVRAPED